MQYQNETPQDYYDRTGRIPDAVNMPSASQLVDAQRRPYITGVSQGPSYYIAPDGSLLDSSDPNVANIYPDQTNNGQESGFGGLVKNGLGMIVGGVAGGALLGGLGGGAAEGSLSAAGGEALGAGASGLGAAAPAAGLAFGAPNETMAGPAIPGAGAAATPWGTAANAAATAAGGAATQSALSRILSGTATNDDLMKIAGIATPALLQYLSSSKQADQLQNIYNQTRADRSVALGKYNEALTNPKSYYDGDVGMGSIDSILRALSVNGNPAANPGLLSKAAALNQGGYQGYLRTLEPAAFGTAATEANVGSAAAGATGQELSGLAYGLGSILNPQPTLSDTIKSLGLNIGGMAYRG